MFIKHDLQPTLLAESQTAHKVCTKCNKSKPLTEFHKKGKRLDSRCAVCVGKLKKEIREAKKHKKAIKRKTKVLDVDSLRIQEYTVDRATVSLDQFKMCLRNYAMDIVLNLANGKEEDDECKK